MMKDVLLAVLIVAILPAGRLAAQPVPVIFDTDMGNDVDDALALAMLHALESRGEAELLGVTITKDNRWAAPYVDLVNTFYSRGDRPIGVVTDGVTPDDSPMIQAPAEQTGADGRLRFPHDLTDGRTAPGAVAVLRRLLASAADSSVVIIQVGFSTNLARLLGSRDDDYSPLAGRDLVRQKVRLLSVMAGAYPDGEEPEYNVKTDVPSAQRLFQDWPTPIVASGFEVGETILYPASSIERHFDYVPHHPIVEAYRHYMEMPYDRPTWDLTSVLYAVRPDEGYFTPSAPGTIVVDDEGRTRFRAEAKGQHRYLKADDWQRARALEAMIYLVSQPPE